MDMTKNLTAAMAAANVNGVKDLYRMLQKYKAHQYGESSMNLMNFCNRNLRHLDSYEEAVLDVRPYALAAAAYLALNILAGSDDQMTFRKVGQLKDPEALCREVGASFECACMELLKSLEIAEEHDR